MYCSNHSNLSDKAAVLLVLLGVGRGMKKGDYPQQQHKKEKRRGKKRRVVSVGGGVVWGRNKLLYMVTFWGELCAWGGDKVHVVGEI